MFHIHNLATFQLAKKTERDHQPLELEQLIKGFTTMQTSNMHYHSTHFQQRKPIAILTILLFLTFSPTGWADFSSQWQPGDDYMSPTQKTDFKPLQKAGESKYKLLWKTITDAALYIDPKADAPEDIMDPNYEKRLVIEYGLGVSKDRFIKMAKDTLAKYWDAKDLEQSKSELEQFYSWMTDVEKGDRYGVHWHPKNGFVLSLNEKPQGSWQSAEAAKIILSIWLGKASISHDQRDDILKQWRKATEA